MHMQQYVKKSRRSNSESQVYSWDLHKLQGQPPFVTNPYALPTRPHPIVAPEDPALLQGKHALHNMLCSPPQPCVLPYTSLKSCHPTQSSPLPPPPTSPWPPGMAPVQPTLLHGKLAPDSRCCQPLSCRTYSAMRLPQVSPQPASNSPCSARCASAARRALPGRARGHWSGAGICRLAAGPAAA
jgi:hypothetical protein